VEVEEEKEKLSKVMVELEEEKRKNVNSIAELEEEKRKNTNSIADLHVACTTVRRRTAEADVAMVRQQVEAEFVMKLREKEIAMNELERELKEEIVAKDKIIADLKRKLDNNLPEQFADQIKRYFY